MKSRFHEAADAELTEAILYYDAKALGLDRCSVRVHQTIRCTPAMEAGVFRRASR